MGRGFTQRVPPVAVLCVMGLAAALFFQGAAVLWLCVSLTAFIAALVWSHRRPDDWRLPLTPFVLCLGVLYAWFALSLAWTPVPVTSTITVWWLALLPIAFLVMVAPDGRAAWPLIRRAVVVLALLLCVDAWHQAVVAHAVPQSVFLNTNSQDAFLSVAVFLALAQAATRRANGARHAWLSECAALVLLTTIAMTGERGPLVALVLGLVAWTAIAYRAQRPVSRVLPFGLLAMAMLLSVGATHWWSLATSAARLATLASPHTALATRIVIWKGALALARVAPWHGVGMGLFSLSYPPYRLPGDTSAGFYVHDDYLQFLIEGGWPAFLLLLALLGSSFALLIRGLRTFAPDDPRRIEWGGLWSAVAAMAIHSLVDFNFYVPSLLILLGFLLGEIHATVVPMPARANGVKSPLSLGGYRALLGVLALFPVVYFIEVAGSDFYLSRAVAAVNQGADWETADRDFRIAHRLSPDSDIVLMSEADLYRLVLANWPSRFRSERGPFFAEARHLLTLARRDNRLRAETPWIWGELDLEHPHLAGRDWARRAARHFQAALALDPLEYRARFDAALLLWHQGRTQAAARLAAAGADYWYAPTPGLLPYEGLVASLARATGNGALAARMAERMAAIRASYPQSALSVRVAHLVTGAPVVGAWDRP